jgi:chloramphenicol 3-O phosphotransferase
MSGWVVVLNGAPRSGKSSIADALMSGRPGEWATHGVDASMARTPEALLPGVGLRPGGERPDLEPHLVELFRSLCAEVARLARTGRNVAVDIGLHDDYSQPLGIPEHVAGWLTGVPVLWVGVRCDLDKIMRRRDDAEGGYVGSRADGAVPAPVARWEHAVHGRAYDVEVDTTSTSAHDCAMTILAHLERGLGGGEGPEGPQD